MSYTIEKLKPYKCDIAKKWTVSGNLTSLETFDNCDSNYDVIDRLKENKVMTDSCEDDSEYCQAWFYFKSKSAADSFIKRLDTYIQKRKQLINSL